MLKKVSLALIAITFVFAVNTLAVEKFPMLWMNGQAPDFTLQNPDGKKISLSDFKDRKAVVIFFWHSENAGCITQLKALQKLINDKKLGKDVQVLTVTFGKEVKQRDDSVAKFKENGLDFPILFEKREDLSATNVEYQVTWLPAIYLITKDGDIASPMITSVTDKSGGKTFEQRLRDAIRNKNTNACEFMPEKNYDNKDYKKLYDYIGKPAPDFIGTDDKGKKQAPGYFKGFRNLIILFWSPGCPHCRRELPQVMNYYKRYADKQDTEVITVLLDNADKSKSAAKDFFNMYGIKFPIIGNENNKITDAYNVNSVPTAFFVDKKGIVRDVFIGEMSLAGDMFKCAVNKLK